MDYKEAFVDRFADVALAISMATGVRPEVVLGQTALETGYGKSVAGNNMFGVKGAGQMVTTHEDYGKGLSKTRESFRAYSNPKASFEDYGKLMGSGRYGGVRAGTSVREQIAALGKSGYATDKKYSSKMAEIVSEIQGTKSFQSALANHQADLIDTQVGVQDLPGSLYGMPPENYGVPVADLPASPYGVNDINDYSFAAPETPDVMSQMPGPDYSDLSATMYGNYHAPDVPSTPDPMTTMDGPTYPGLSQSMYDGPPVGDVSAPSVPDINGLSLDNYGPNIGEMGYAPSGHHAGEDFGPADLANTNSQTTAAQQNYDTAQRNYDAQKAAYDRDMNAYDQATKSFSANSHYTNDVLNAPLGTIGMSGLTAFGFDLPAGMKVSAPAPVAPTRPVAPTPPPAPPPAPVPKALPAQEMAQEATNDQHPHATPSGLGAQFGTFDNFLGAMNAHNPDAMNAINNAGMGYAASYAMGDGPYATMGTNDLQDKFGSQFGMDGRKGIAEGFKQDYGQLSPTARGGLEGAMKGLAMGGPFGMLAGGAFGTLGGYAMPNGIGGLFDGTFGTGLERGTPGNMSNFGSPYDGAGLAGPYDSLFGGAPGAAGNLHDMQAIQDAYDARNSGGLGGLFDGGSFGGDPSQDGGARYS